MPLTKCLVATGGVAALRRYMQHQSLSKLTLSLLLQQLMPFTKCVVATGGGAVLRRKNWGYMQHGVVIWLDGSPELLASHVVGQPGGTRSRPLIFSNTDVKEQVWLS